MDDEINLSKIEKIKLLEQEKDTKLKEKRVLETTLTSLKRSLNETTKVTRKLQEEAEEATARADAAHGALEAARTLQACLTAQLEAWDKQLQLLKIQSEEGISKVWESRNGLCNEVHKVSDQCDVWALFTKPKYIQQSASKPQKLPNDNENQQPGLLEIAEKRRQTLNEERDRLLNEPEFGEEFKRKCLTYQTSHRLASTNVQENENEPIKFSTSPAAKRTVKPIVKKTTINMPWYQPYSVIVSVSVFLIYFCILREENNMDQEFNKTLYERIHGLEKEQLLQSYRYNKENGISVEEIEKRLREIAAEESEKQRND